MAPTLLQLFPQPSDLLALQPEDLAEVLMEVIPGVCQSAGFLHTNLIDQVQPPHGGQGYSHHSLPAVRQAIGEATSWLETQGLIVRNHGQPADWYLVTRRGQALKTRTDVAAYRLGRTLPIELLQPQLADKVHHLYLRGDHDTAVFQAFKEVEMAVREAGRYGEDQVGVALMRLAFHPEKGPLRDVDAVFGEREAMASLFAGAMGHAKNPPSHREVRLHRQTAARLIVFASHLLDIVEVQRALRV